MHVIAKWIEREQAKYELWNQTILKVFQQMVDERL